MERVLPQGSRATPGLQGTTPRPPRRRQAIYGELQSFQERLQRCLVRCQDRAQESLPADRDPSEAQMKKAQDQLLGCMDACAKEYSGAVPKLRSGIEAALKKIPRA